MFGFDAFCEGPFSSLDIEGVSGVVPFYFSDRGYNSFPRDRLPNTTFRPRVKTAGFIERSLPLYPLQARRVGIAFGEIVLNNEDGALDDVVDRYAIDGRRVVIRAGWKDLSYDNFRTVFDGTATGWTADESEARISIRDEMYRLDVPIQGLLYDGSGGLNGGADISGKPRPLAFGKCFNVPLTLVDPTRLIYQGHSGLLRAIDTVYDRGLALSNAGEVADIEAAVVPAGNFKYQLDGGYVRLGSTPAGLITADLQGDVLDGTYVDTTANISRRIMTHYAGIDETELNIGSFESMNGVNAATVGIFVGSEVTLASDVINRLLVGVGGWITPDRDGLIKVGILKAAFGSPQVVLNERNIVSIQRLQLPPQLDPCIYRARVGYQFNNSVQPNDIASAVTADRRAFLSEQYRIASDVDLSLLPRFLMAKDLDVIPAYYAEKADADAEVARQLELWGTLRRPYAITVKGIGLTADLNDQAHVTFPRYNFDSGDITRIVGVREDFDLNQVVFTVLR